MAVGPLLQGIPFPLVVQVVVALVEAEKLGIVGSDENWETFAVMLPKT